MLYVEIILANSNAVWRAADRVSMSPPLRRGKAILGTGFQKDAALLRAIRGRGSQAASDRSQTPFLDICLNKDETRLTKVDVNCRGPVGPDSREEVLRL